MIAFASVTKGRRRTSQFLGISGTHSVNQNAVRSRYAAGWR